MSESTPKATAQKLVDNLTTFYDKYRAASEALQQQANAGSQLGYWFTGRNPVADNDLHKKFYEAVEKRCTLLDGYLSQLSPEEAHPLAAQAVAVVLDPVPDCLRDAGGWMRFAAEPLCAPLFRYLSRGELEAIRRHYLEIYPKRKLFKQQKALLKQLDHWIQDQS